MPDLHIDLESLDTTPTSVITEIGAVCGDSEFHRHLNGEIYAAPKYADRFTASGDTLAWRLKNAPNIAPAGSSDVVVALAEFVNWCGELEFSEVWANGPAFDCIILQHHFRVFGFVCPWQFWQERDVRTLKAAAELLAIPFEGYTVPHHALEDAKLQRRAVEQIKFGALANVSDRHAAGELKAADDFPVCRSTVAAVNFLREAGASVFGRATLREELGTAGLTRRAAYRAIDELVERGVLIDKGIRLEVNPGALEAVA